MDALEVLTEINLDDLVSSFGWQPGGAPAGLLRRLFRAPAGKFARQMLAFDEVVGRDGLTVAARRTLKDFASGLRVSGLENLPRSGPLLFLSNHPGMVDTLALFTAIQRADLRSIALNRPFLRSLPHTTNQLFFISDEPAERMSAVKKAAAYLRAGGALLTFPAGQIEPDPLVYPGALESLDKWSDSAGVFLRLAPQTRIVPALVSGVLWEPAVKHALTRIKKTRQEREKLGAALQLLAHILFDARPLQVRVQFAAALDLDEIGSNATPAIHAAVLARMRGLLALPGEPDDMLSLSL